MIEGKLRGFEDKTKTKESNRINEKVDKNSKVEEERKTNNELTWKIC